MIPALFSEGPSARVTSLSSPYTLLSLVINPYFALPISDESTAPIGPTSYRRAWHSHHLLHQNQRTVLLYGWKPNFLVLTERQQEVLAWQVCQASLHCEEELHLTENLSLAALPSTVLGDVQKRDTNKHRQAHERSVSRRGVPNNLNRATVGFQQHHSRNIDVSANSRILSKANISIHQTECLKYLFRSGRDMMFPYLPKL